MDVYIYEVVELWRRYVVDVCSCGVMYLWICVLVKLLIYGVV